MSDLTSFNLQALGGWILFADMVLVAVLFAFWEKAGRMRIRLGRRPGSKRS